MSKKTENEVINSISKLLILNANLQLENEKLSKSLTHIQILTQTLLADFKQTLLDNDKATTLNNQSVDLLSLTPRELKLMGLSRLEILNLLYPFANWSTNDTVRPSFVLKECGFCHTKRSVKDNVGNINIYCNQCPTELKKLYRGVNPIGISPTPENIKHRMELEARFGNTPKQANQPNDVNQANVVISITSPNDVTKPNDVLITKAPKQANQPDDVKPTPTVDSDFDWILPTDNGVIISELED